MKKFNKEKRSEQLIEENELEVLLGLIYEDLHAENGKKTPLSLKNYIMKVNMMKSDISHSKSIRDI